MDHLLGRSAICDFVLLQSLILHIPSAGALSNPCFPCKTRRLYAQKTTHQHLLRGGFGLDADLT